MKRNLWIIILLIRKVTWSLFFGLIFNIVYLIKWVFDKKSHSRFFEVRKLWGAIIGIDQIYSFIRDKYVYSYDDFRAGLDKKKWRGWMDHDPTYFEWFMRFGDCDSISLMIKRKLKQIGIKKAYRIWFKGKGVFTGHFDCLFYMNGDWYLFNYGNSIIGKSIKEVVYNFGCRWEVYRGTAWTVEF